MALKQSWFNGLRNGDRVWTKLSYLSLHTGANPTSGNELDPNVAGGYARVNVARADYTYTKGVQDRWALNKNKDFPRATTAWGDVLSLGISSASAPGSVIDGAGVLSRPP